MLIFVFFFSFYRVTTLQQVYRRHQLDKEQLDEELEQTVKEMDECELRAPQLAQRFRYYQELRGYVTDLVECLDEKVGLYAVTFLLELFLSLSRDTSRYLDTYSAYCIVTKRRKNVFFWFTKKFYISSNSQSSGVEMSWLHP